MNNNNLIVIARMCAKESQEEQTKNELTKLIAPTLKEEGCIKYELHTSFTDPKEFMFYEIWTSKDALDKHGQSEHIQAFRAVRENYIDGPTDVTLWNCI
jgi:quinol monooxygenase YgiN